MLAISAYKKYSASKKQQKLNDENNDPDTNSQSTPPDPIESTKAERRLARENQFKSTRKALLKRQLLSLAVILIVDVALPLILYYTLRNTIGPVYALLISGIPPLLQVIFGFIRNRKVHALGCMIVIAFIVSAVVSIITGDARIAVLRESIITGIVGILFLITSIPFHFRNFTNRTLIFLISQQIFSEFPPITWTDKTGEKHEMPIIEWLDIYYRPMHIYFRLLNVFWAIGLLGECAARIAMIEATDLSIDDIVKYGTIMVATVSSVLGVYSSIHSGILRRRSQVYLHDWLDEHDFSHEFESADKKDDNATFEANRQSDSESEITNNNSSKLETKTDKIEVVVS
ncbi:hypothetical protein K501DRAFT_260564 [Backusella circina FSU 941]|nr:hypothetical protein K501DRAFT_260564 [Backusella circina FSU 941]